MTSPGGCPLAGSAGATRSWGPADCLSTDGGGSLLSAETRTTAGDAGFAWGTGASWARPSSGIGSTAGPDEYSPASPGGGTTAGMGGGGGTGTRPLFSGAVGVGAGGVCCGADAGIGGPVGGGVDFVAVC